jgi:hypothetical protein
MRRALVALFLELRFQRLQRGSDFAQLLAELPEQVGRGFEAALLFLQPRHLGRQRLPVELVEVGVLVEFRQRRQARLERVLFLLDPADAAAQLGQPHFERPRLGFERGDLGGVGPAEHVAAAVVEAVAVVLFVPLAGGLDLAGAGDRAQLAAELLLRGAAGDVEAVRQLALEPVVVRRVGLDRQLARQRVAVQVGKFAARTATDAEIDQPPPELGLVDPLGDLGVIVVGHQQRQAEVAQQPLGGAFPVALVVAHLQQLAGKGHGVFGQRQRPTQCAAHRHLFGRDVAAPRLETADLGRQLVVFELALAQADAVLGELVLQPGLAFPGGFGQRRPALSLVEKRRFVGAGRVADGAHQVGVALRLALPRLAIVVEPTNLGRQPFEAIAAVVGDVLLEFASCARCASRCASLRLTCASWRRQSSARPARRLSSRPSLRLAK